ncbi:2Fe-2S iron-sulfur cluster-binding protein [Haliangium sp.]|uniref:2Fe-2S iron-sulfur cluster-binding protein n=1 Tax=Haliangium sp. TaxID=2663208 RepID=UPI003D147906
MSDTETQAPAPPPVDTVTLTIDGQEVTVPKGTNVLEAARSIGIDISAFCYHPGLSIAACCRQCLVSVEKAPKLQPSCQTTAADGMVVSVSDDRSTLARKQMLEFTLVNHPIDCPICDKAGECTLQKLYFEHDNAPSRVDVPKVHKPKVVDLGPHIVLDAERCILCTRCIRVCDEVAGEHQLEMSNRGDHEELGTAPGAQLDNPYSLNTVDVCPVGALTSKDFRFTMRAWELYATPSVCNGCATGCNVELHHRNERVWRLVPRHNPEVNQYWMCDEGRFTYHELRQDRLAGPTQDGLPSSWERALKAAAGKLEALLSDGGGAGVGVVLSARHTNEDNYALSRLAHDILGLDHIFLGASAPAPERADNILRDADPNANRAGVEAIAAAAGYSLGDQAALEQALEDGSLRALVVLGHELALSDEALAKAKALDALVVVSWREQGLATVADVALPCASWAEVNGTVTNRQGKVQRMHAAYAPLGQALPAWEVVVRLAQACGAALNYTDPKKLFEEMAGKVAAFKGAEWGKPARSIQLRFAGSRG